MADPPVDIGNLTIDEIILSNDTNAGDLVLNDSLLALNVSAPEDFIVVYSASAIFLSLLLIGFVSVNIFITVLIRGNKTFSEFPFFSIVWQLVIVNEIHMLTQLSTVLPLMLITVDENDTVGQLWNKLGGSLIHLTEEGASYFTLLMTVNRFSIFVMPRLSFLFEGKKLQWTILAVWLVVLLITIARFTLGLTRSFNKNNFSFDDIIQVGNTAISMFFNLLSFFIPLLIFVLYILIFIFLRNKRKTSLPGARITRDDRSFITQTGSTN